MGIDPSLILGIKQPQFASPDPLEQYGKVMTLKHLLQQGEVAQRALADDDATRDAFKQSGGDPATLRALLAGSGQYKAVQALDKAQLEQQEKRSTIDKNKAQTGNYQQEAVTRANAVYRDQLSSVDSPQAAAQWLSAGYQDPVLGPVLSRLGTLEQAVSSIPQDPAQFQRWKQEKALGATKFIELNKPHITNQDVGGTARIVATPGLGGAPEVLSETKKTPTIGEVESQRHNRATEGNAAAQLGLSRERLNFERSQPRGQFITTENGIFLADPRSGTARPAVGPEGQPLEKPLKQIPGNANTAILENAQNLRRAEQALALVEGKKVGSAQGDKEATGWKGYAPGALLNRFDPEGVDTRAAIADLGSLIIHERSGAAVTAAESPRLMPFIPLTTDDHATAVKKLKRFTEIYRDMTNNLAETYSKEQGYKPNPVNTRGAMQSGVTAPSAPGVTQSDIDAELRRRGVIK